MIALTETRRKSRGCATLDATSNLEGKEDVVVRMLSLAIVLVFVSSSAVRGHHSFAAHYLEEESVTIEGTLVTFDYRAPHAWVHVSVAGADGAVQEFAAEWANPNRLARDGITKDTLKAGDRLILTGSPGRTASENRVHLKRIERPADGWQWVGRRRR